MLPHAIHHHQAGRLDEAEKLYRSLLANNPNHVDALNLLGVLERQRGNFEAALAVIGQAISHKASIPDFHFNQAEALRALGRYAEAVAAYDRTIALRGSDAEAHHARGVCLDRMGQSQSAAASFRQALRLLPGYTAAAADLAALLLRQGEAHEAMRVCKDALLRHPAHADCQFQLGAALAKLGRHQEAVAAYQAAANARPGWVEAHINLAASLARLARFGEAADEARKAVALKPDSAEALLNLGAAAEKMGRHDEALDAYRRAIALKPQYAEAHNNLGLVLIKRGKLTEGIKAFEQAITFKADYAEAYSNLGNALKGQGRLFEALKAYHKAIELDPDSSAAHSNLLLALNYCPELPPQQIFDEHRRWGQRQGNTAPATPAAIDCNPDRRLRIGYVSPDFREHSVSFFFEPLLSAHVRTAFEITCYCDLSNPDAVTRRLESRSDRWRTIAGMPDEQVARMIHDDRIDILVDLAGHTGNNRLSLFARRPAPLQITYLGYPSTTGLRQIQYRLTDALADPPGMTQTFHSEELIRLPRCFLCYRPPADAPPVSPLPADAAGCITFGSFNQLAKINEPLIELWSDVLKAIPTSRLLLKTKNLADPSARASISHAFAARGIQPFRLKLAGPDKTVAGHLARYAHVDIALDTYPYQGTTTTCEALWMGVPVVTLAGPTHVSRVGLSLLSCLGLDQLVATSREDYVAISKELAGDVPRLRKTRSAMRQQMATSPLMDAKLFAQSVESSYRSLWQRHCSKPAMSMPDSCT